MSSNKKRELLDKSVDCLRMYKQLVDEHLPNNNSITNKTDEDTNIKELLKQYCDLDIQNQHQERVIQLLKDDNTPIEQENVEIRTLYDKLSDEERRKSESGPSTSEKRYLNHRFWLEVYQGGTEVEEVSSEQNKTLPLPDNAYVETNDSILMANVFEPPSDPISKRKITDPYKSTYCGHVYEHKYIVQYIKSMGNKAKCPYVGCRNVKLSMHGLQRDNETRRKIDEYNRTHRDGHGSDEEEDSSD